MIDYCKYFGGTDITLDKLLKVYPRHGVDGTNYKTENWLAECAVMESLVPGKTMVWVPYGGACFYSKLKEVVWDKYELKNYSFPEECKDWWLYEPYMVVEHPDGEEYCYWVYEYSFYKRIKHKLRDWNKKPRIVKGKFLSKLDIAKLKRQENIDNSKRKRK